MTTTTFDHVAAQPSGSRSDTRGRAAATPLHIPARGWREILSRTYAEIQNNRTLLVAAGTTFYLLLSMVPSLTALISIYGLFNDPASVQQHLAFLQPYLPDGGRQILDEQLARIAGQADTSLGLAAIISLGAALWSTNAGMKALIEAMNVAYGEREKRSFIKLTLVSLAFTLGAIALLLCLIGVIVLLPVVLNLIGIDTSGGTGLILRISSGLALALAALFALTALYRWGPSRERAKWKWVTPGAGIALVVAMIASTAFSFYVARFGSYNETYGSLGAIIGFMTWLWIMVVFVVTGAELNAEMERQTVKDSTTGASRPLGARGALAADTVADGPKDVPEETPGLQRSEPDAERNSNGRSAASASGRRAGRRRRFERDTDGPRSIGWLLASGVALLLLSRDLAEGSDGVGGAQPGRGGRTSA